MANGVAAWIDKSDARVSKPTDAERLDRLQASIDGIGQQLERIADLIALHPPIATAVDLQRIQDARRELLASSGLNPHAIGGEP